MKVLIICFLCIACGTKKATLKSSAADLSPSDNEDSLERNFLLSEPTNLYINSKFTEVEVDALKNAAESWNRESGTNFFKSTEIIDKDIVYPENFEDSKIGIYITEKDWIKQFEAASALAATVIQIKGNQIKKDVFFNYELFSFGTNGNEVQYDFESVASHELGHVLGLGHSEIDELAVMSAQIGRGVIKRVPTQVDIDNLLSLYESNTLQLNIQKDQTINKVIHVQYANGDCEIKSL